MTPIQPKLGYIIRTNLLTLLFALTLFACSKPGQQSTEPATPTADTLLLHIIRAITDSSISCVDYKEDFMMFLDTMETQVMSYPDESVRIGAKSFAIDLFGYFMSNDNLSPEDKQFFDDSLVLPLVDIMFAWYRPDYSSNDITDDDIRLVLSQTLLHKFDGPENYVIYMDLYQLPDDKERLVITLPKEAESLVSIIFHNGDMREIDNGLHLTKVDALQIEERTDESGETLVFGNDFVDAMLAHEGMFISYFAEGEAEHWEDLFRSCHLPLALFQKQYQELK